MADRFGSQPFFDTFRRRTRPLLSESEELSMGLLDKFLTALPAAQQTSDPAMTQQLQGAGFLPVPGQADPETGAVPFITPERLKATLLRKQVEAQQAQIQNRYDESMDSALFRVADTLADTGRFFLSPLLFLGGFNFDSYDPSAQRRSGFRRELGALASQQNDMVDYLIQARDDRSETLREIQEDAAKLGPFGGMGESMNSWSSRTLYSPDRDPSSPQYAAAYQHMFGETTAFDNETGRPYTYRRAVDPTVPLPTGYQTEPVMQPQPQAPEQADASTTVVPPVATPVTTPIAPAGTPMGGPSEKRTDASNKAEVYGGQMFEPAAIMMQMEQQGYRLSPLALKAVDMFGQAAYQSPFISEEDKAYLAAMNSFINGRLRFESGAAITDEDYKQALRQTAAVSGVDGGALATIQRQRFNTLEAVIRSTAPSFRDSPNTAAALKAIRDSLPPAYQYTPEGEENDMVEIPDQFLIPGVN